LTWSSSTSNPEEGGTINPPIWFDTHAHLSDAQFDRDRSEVLDRAFTSAVNGIIEIADGPQEWEKAKSLAETRPSKIWWAAGLHPYYADQISETVLHDLKATSEHPQFVAVGEIGLDYAKCPISHDVQKHTLVRMLEFSHQIEKPVILHCRDAYPDLITVLTSFYGKSRHASAPPPGVVHCFSGNAEDAGALLEMGFYIGVDGPITYPSARSLRETIQTIPVEKLVIETDAPYLPPQPFRGQRNESSYISHVGEKLAEIKKLSSNQLATILRQNSDTVFQLKMP